MDEEKRYTKKDVDDAVAKSLCEAHVEFCSKMAREEAANNHLREQNRKKDEIIYNLSVVLKGEVR